MSCATYGRRLGLHWTFNNLGGSGSQDRGASKLLNFRTGGAFKYGYRRWPIVSAIRQKAMVSPCHLEKNGGAFPAAWIVAFKTGLSAGAATRSAGCGSPAPGTA